MTLEQESIADTYKSITEAEKQADALEKMLDNLDSKLDSILNDIERKPVEPSGEEAMTEP